MKTKIYTIGSGDDDKAFRTAAKLIRSGKLVCFPTETVYGLGCSALDGEAALRVFRAKNRPADNPLIVHVAQPSETERFAFTNPLFEKLAERFMPGPLTVVLKKKDIIPKEVVCGGDTVAVRCPSHPVAHRLIAECTVPIAAPSANLSGKPSPTTAAHVISDMNGRVSMILDGGDATFGLESTVVRLLDDGIVILRPGAVTREMLMEVTENVKVDPGVTDPSSVHGPVASPGMKYRHYAPEAKVILVDADRENFRDYVNRCGVFGDGVLSFVEDLPFYRPCLTKISIGRSSDKKDECHELFAALRRADELKCARVFVMKPSEKGVELALFNRLIRASECKITTPEKTT
ncbi:MAG: threonylcarbamoyl-AMP synthase [Clostridia bacterium]|nr:threonylcarbamoyl-AMP synthase [Clostridia bacterium]